MNAIPRFPRVLVVCCLLLLSTILSISPPPPAAIAQTPAETSAGRIVERWHGTVTEEQANDNTYAPDCPWVCVGNYHYSALQEWYLEVYDDGTVTGYIRSEVIDYSYSQTKTNNSCGPVAETNYTLNDCTFTGQLLQPQSTFTVQGMRELEQFTQKPILRFTAVAASQKCESNWTARGIHSETGAIVNKQETADCDRPPYEKSTFYIVTHGNGQPPQIIIDYSSDAGGVRSATFGILTATTEEPMLELDREFLDRSIFLDQVSVEEAFVAKTEWNSPGGGWLTWQLAESEPERIGPSEAEEFPKPLNAGMQGTGKKKLTVQVQSTLNRTSSPENTQITVAPPPGWAGSPAQITATKVKGAVSYKNSIRFPTPPFEGIVTVPVGLPWIGGYRLGLSRTQGFLAWEAKSTQEGQGTVSAQTGFEAMGGKALGHLTGNARVVLDESGVKIPEGGIVFSISGQIASKPESLFKVIPSLTPAITAIERISPSAAGWLRERAQAKLELLPRLDFGFNFFTEDDEIKFKNAQAKPGFGFRTIIEINIIKKVLQAAASIGGTISATFQVPEPYFKEAALQGLVQGQVTFYRWAWRGEKAWSVVLSNAQAAIASADQLWTADSGSDLWEVVARPYLAMPNYARWHGGQATVQATALTPGDEVLVENVSPQAYPSLHVFTNSVGQTRLVQSWTHEKADAPALSAGEIAVSRNFGSSWQEPTFLTEDNVDDFAPQAVFLENGQTMVLWQRMDTATPPDFNDDPGGYLSHWQIAAQLLSADTPKILSTGGSFNYHHQLGATTGGALAVWVNNPANQLVGSAANRDHILYSHYTITGNKWTTATAVISNVIGVLDLELATNGQFGALVYSADINGDLLSTTDRELYYATWNGSSWSAPTRLTNNGLADEDPELALDESGMPVLVWRQNGVLKFVQGGWTNPPITLPLPNAAARPDFELARSSDGHLALVWQHVGPEDTRLGYALYDATHDRWSSELSVTPPEGMAGSMATNIVAGLVPADEDEEGDAGSLVFAYQLAQVQLVTKTVEVEGKMTPIGNVPEITQYDLRFATAPLRTNLSVAPADLTIVAADKIQAVIHNTGDLAVANAPVVLHLGPADPVSGATQTTVQNIPVLAAGAVATVTFTVADPSISLLVVEIDPDQTLLESDVSDNRATLGTDVAIDTLPAFYSPLGTAVRAQVTQNGPRYVSLMAPATLTLDSPTGPVVGSGQFSFPLAPTEPVTLTTFISTTLLGAGRHHLYWTLDPAETLGETNRSNNVAGTSIMILPDLAALDETIYFGKSPGSSAPFSLTVQNTGNWPSAATTVTVLDGPPGASGTQALLTLPLPAIEPGGRAEISGMLQLAGLPVAATGLAGIYVQLDPSGAVAESNENNNLVAAGAILEGLANPARRELFMPSLHR